MNIGIVINTSWNIFNFRKGLIEAIKKEGHTVFAIAPSDEYSKKIEDVLGIEFIPVSIDSKSTNPIKDFKLIFELRKIYLENNLDYVFQFTIKPNIYGSLATLWTNVKTVNNVSGLGTTFIRKNLLSFFVKRLYKVAFLKVNYVFFQNIDDRNLFLNNKLLNIEKTGVLPGSGVPLNEIIFSPRKERGEGLVFFMSARLLIDKGLGEYIKAAKKIKEEFGDTAKFILCGKPEENPKLGFSEKMAFQWQEEETVKYLGHVDNVIDFLNEVDVVVLPSYREGTPRALLEACAVGRPILATDAPGCREVVIDELNGLTCEVKNANSLYLCMKKFLEMSNEQILEMGKESRKLVERKFDEKFVIQAYLEFINKNNGDN